MEWVRAAAQHPPLNTPVLGVVQEPKGHRAVRIVIWNGSGWTFASSGNELTRYGHQVTHWMPVPALPPSA